MGYITQGFKALYEKTIGSVIRKLKNDEVYSEISMLSLIKQNLFLYPLGKFLQQLGLIYLKFSVKISFEGEYAIYQNKEEVIYWPIAYSLQVPLFILGEILPYSSHNYFDLYTPNKEDIIFDIGACEGSFGLRCLQKYNVKKVYFFEPISLTISALRLTLKKYIGGRAEVHATAIADVEGETIFSYDPHHIEASHILRQSAEGEKVSMTTIDKFVEQHNIKKLNLIKMDIEGSEMSALRGACVTLQKLRPHVLVCAYHHPNDYKDLYVFFTQNGYELVKSTWGFPPKVCLYSPCR
ncbi:MAG: FkbM family methyltransferase [Synergistaceae bacterium]|jgi:FkbM family methyltransferase|nr:FkbM family methyltransferase [Synergistaceae bacterium]